MSEHHDHRDDCPFKFATLDICDCVEKNMLDRIEALTEQLTAARQDAKEAEAYAEELERDLNTCRMAQAVMDNTVADLEAKLAKSVEVIEWALISWDEHNKYGHNMQGDWVSDARATLAEIQSG